MLSTLTIPFLVVFCILLQNFLLPAGTALPPVPACTDTGYVYTGAGRVFERPNIRSAPCERCLRLLS